MMDNVTLRKVQLAQLEIAKEIKRICDAQHIPYFLTGGTMLGAVRHGGFIPWDDDLDIGMPQDAYERFCAVAPELLNEKYYMQTWDNDKGYAQPFLKIRKKGTKFIEEKANIKKPDGIFVDVFPLQNAPDDAAQLDKLNRKMLFYYRLLLMKCHYRPWRDNGKTHRIKRFAYLFYQCLAAFCSKEKLKARLTRLQQSVPSGEFVYEQIGSRQLPQLPKRWFMHLKETKFEDAMFPIPEEADAYLTLCYGNYMEFPPENERYNRHQIIELDLGEAT